MDRRVKTLVGALVLFGVIIAAVLIAQGSGDDGSEEPVEGEKPTVEVPEGPPPEELEIEDLEEGEGAEAQEGDALEVDYVGVLYDTGDEFDNSYDPGKMPIPVTLGQGGVIPGFEQGLEGMKVGGQRQIIIPPDLGYGPEGQPPDIPPDSTLIFVVELLSIN
jgi:peptidylprolyl isomerase